MGIISHCWDVFDLGARRPKLGRTCGLSESGGLASFFDHAAQRLSFDLCQVSRRRSAGLWWTHGTGTEPVQGGTAWIAETTWWFLRSRSLAKEPCELCNICSHVSQSLAQGAWNEAKVVSAAKLNRAEGQVLTPTSRSACARGSWVGIPPVQAIRSSGATEMRPAESMSCEPSMKPARFGRSSANCARVDAMLVQEFTKPRFLRFGKRPGRRWTRRSAILAHQGQCGLHDRNVRAAHFLRAELFEDANAVNEVRRADEIP